MPAQGFPTKNQLLSALPERDFHRVQPFLERTSLKARRVLHHWNMPIEQVHFVETGLISVVAKADHDTALEVWTTGSEGVAGIPVVLGSEGPSYRWVVQLEGSALSMSTVDLHRLMDDLPAFREALFRYVQVVLHQTSQTGACNGSHSLQQRLARCLLLARDRAGETELALTHTMLSRTLGVRRASITERMASLEEAGVIEKGRGAIRILDGDKLEEMACSCYRSIRFQHDRLLRGARGAADRSVPADAHEGLRCCTVELASHASV